MESGRRDSNPYGLTRASPRRNFLATSTSFQSQRVYRFRHARSGVWCLRSGKADVTSLTVSSSTRIKSNGRKVHTTNNAVSHIYQVRK